MYVMEGDNISIVSGPRCRICLSDENTDLIAPCGCSGTVGMLHAECLERWASVSCRLFCEICKCKYKGEREQRYGIVTSIMPFIRSNWNGSKVLVFIQTTLLFVMVNMEIRNYSVNADDPDYPKSSWLFSFWCLLTFNLLVYYICFSIACLVKSWNIWRRSQFVFVSCTRTV